MKHLFDIEIAKQYGVNAAVLLENIGYWIKQNEANATNYFDGNYWTFNSRRAYKEMFPYMSERQIETAFKKLIDDGLIVTGNYNKLAYDRTLWYALTQKGKCILHFDGMDYPKMLNGLPQNVKPIPNINTNINTDVNAVVVDDGGDQLQDFSGVMLTDNQTADLLDKMGLEAFDFYFEKAKKYPNIKNYYKTILKWYDEDRTVKV